MKKFAVLGVLMLACAPVPNAAELGHVWTVADFVRGGPDAGRDADWGGWTARQLVVKPGEPVPFRSAPFAAADVPMRSSGPGLVALPGFAASEPIAYVITDIWYQTPQPWVQPTYLLPKQTTVFPVDVKGRFYSSFWRAVFVSKSYEAQSATEVLNGLTPNGATMTEGDIILCPIVPRDTTIARGELEKLPIHPFTGHHVTVNEGAGLWASSLSTVPAWVDHAEVWYLSFGTWRAKAEGDQLHASKIFVFGVTEGTRFNMLPLPAVLSDDAVRSSLAQRVEVTLPPGMQAYLPPSKASLAQGLAALGLPLPLESLPATVDVDGGVVIDRSPDGGLVGVAAGDQLLTVDPTTDEGTSLRYMLRIARNPECFRPGRGFPAGCRWLDSQAAIEKWVPGSALHEEYETLSVGVLQEVP